MLGREEEGGGARMGTFDVEAHDEEGKLWESRGRMGFGTVLAMRTWVEPRGGTDLVPKGF